MTIPAPTADDLNVLYDASLEFGENWRRPIAELAVQRLPHIGPDDRAVLVDAVERCRRDVESRVEEQYNRYGDSWPSDAEPEVRQWVTERYPWMSEQNLSHAIAQGVYYAWHG